jgi:tetratricopeptide (TPR) repeat protein
MSDPASASAQALKKTVVAGWTVRPLCIACVALLLIVSMGACVTGTPRLSVVRSPNFDRGMAMYYGFDYDAAIRSFEQAANESKGSALSQWGIALALGPNLNDRAMDDRMAKATAALARARDLAPRESGRVHDLVEALGARYTTAAAFDLDALNRAYADRMKALVAKYPADDDVAVLYAESLMVAQPPQTGHSHALVNEAAVAAVEDVLKRNPTHLGANHYHIHLLETVDPQRALASARRLDGMRPEAGHILHMPSHIYFRLGDYHAAVLSNQRARAADRAAEKATGHLPVMGYHTREFLAAAAGMTGQGAVARDADDSLFVQLRFNRWDEVLQRPRPDGSISQLEWHVARVLALARLGRIEDAAAARIAYATFETTVPADEQWWADPVGKFLPMARHEMDAAIAWAQGNREEAILQWQQGVAAQDGLTRAESVMPWFHSLRESLGAALLLRGRARDAERTFRDDLRINPGSGRALFGLWKALAAQGQSSEEGFPERQFREAWKNADTILSLDGL